MDYNYEAIYKKLFRLQWLLRQQHMQSHAQKGPMADRTRGQGRVLALLKMQPEISTKDLAYLLGIRQQSLNELLNKLEKNGYVMRTPSEADRRVMMVRITDKGKAEQQTEVELPDIFDCLSREEQEVFAGYLDRLIAALEAQLGTEEADEMSDWMESVRSRMGDEMFEHLMSMRGGPHPCGHGFEHGAPGFGGKGHSRSGHGGPEREGHGYGRRGRHGYGGPARRPEDADT